ncbi:MAG: glycosyltransferase family 4 protein [Candidatus Hodarchaeota archaeon]
MDTRVLKQCRTLVSNHYSVTVICLRNRREPKYEEIDGVKVHRLRIHKKRGSIIRYLFEYLYFFFLAFIKLNQLDLKEKFSLIQVNTLPDFLVFATFIQKIRGANILIDMHEIMPEFFISKYKMHYRSPVIKILKYIEKVSLLFANEVITINVPIKNTFKHRSIPHKNITIVMNTVDELIVPAKSKQQKKDFNIVYHGTLGEIYGVDIAIKALKEFFKVNKEFKFYIFGDGPEKEYLDLLINKFGLDNHIFLMGFLPFEEMMKYLENMTIGVLPTRKDVFSDLSFSNKLAEYIYMKIPVIASRLNSTEYYFSEEEITYFSAENSHDLKKQIAFAYNNPRLMKNRAMKAFEKYQSIKWSVMAERYLNLVNSLYD